MEEATDAETHTGIRRNKALSKWIYNPRTPRPRKLPPQAANDAVLGEDPWAASTGEVLILLGIRRNKALLKWIYNPRTPRPGKLPSQAANDDVLGGHPWAEMVLGILFAVSVNIRIRGDPKHHIMVSPSKNQPHPVHSSHRGLIQMTNPAIGST